MEDKNFYMLSKIYEEMQKELGYIKNRVQEMKEMMVSKQDIDRIDYKIEENHTSLLKNYLVTSEGINELEEKMDLLVDKVENQEIKLQVLKN